MRCNVANAVMMKQVTSPIIKVTYSLKFTVWFAPDYVCWADHRFINLDIHILADNIFCIQLAG